MLCSRREGRKGRALVAIDHVEAAFRARMRALAHKGGAVTKQRHGSDPAYYRDIGRLGGSASVAARKARVAAELDSVRFGEAPTGEQCAVPTEAPAAFAHPKGTLKEILADAEMAEARNARALDDSLLQTCKQSETSRAGVAHIQHCSGDDEPWDPWSNRR
jgi:general stress protein YciG